MTGMRRGDSRGSQWLDVDTEHAVIVVRQNAVQVGNIVHVGDVKTATGEGRRIPLDSGTVAVLQSIHERQERDARSWGSDYPDYLNAAALVFTHENGAPYMPEVFTRALPRLIRRYNAEREIHALPDNSPELARLPKHKGMGAGRLERILGDESLTGKPLPAVTWHSLRHLSTSLHLAASQGDVFSVSRRLGHANVTTTATI